MPDISVPAAETDRDDLAHLSSTLGPSAIVCPHCQREQPAETVACEHCGEVLSAPALSEPQVPELGRFSYSLSSLFAFMTVVSVILAVCVVFPPLGLLAIFFVVPAWFRTAWIIRRWTALGKDVSWNKKLDLWLVSTVISMLACAGAFLAGLIVTTLAGAVLMQPMFHVFGEDVAVTLLLLLFLGCALAGYLGIFYFFRDGYPPARLGKLRKRRW